MFMDDTRLFSPAERELLAELDADARCTCGGRGQPAVHDFPPCAARLIKHRHAELVSLQVLAEQALMAASAEPGSHQVGGAREHVQRLLREFFRTAFLGAGLAWRTTHEAGIGVLIDWLIQAVREDIAPWRDERTICGGRNDVPRP